MTTDSSSSDQISSGSDTPEPSPTVAMEEHEPDNETNEEIQRLKDKLKEKDIQIKDKNNEINHLKSQVVEKDVQINNLKLQMAKKDKIIQSLKNRNSKDSDDTTYNDNKNKSFFSKILGL